jgi:hypothetical protein
MVKTRSQGCRANGESLTFLMAPDTGYEISEVLVDKNSVGAINTYTFSNVLSSSNVSVHFNIIPDDSNTHVIKMGEVSVNHKWQWDVQGFSVTPVKAHELLVKLLIFFPSHQHSLSISNTNQI